MNKSPDPNLTIRPFQESDLEQVRAIWNRVVEDGLAFPQEELLDSGETLELVREQTGVNCAEADGRVAGFYILHPNNVGRCGHVANASYAVDPAFRGRRIGEALVIHSLAYAKEQGFQGMQFNAVVCENHRAIKIYLGLGFRILGTVPGGFRLKDGRYVDTLIFYKEL